jgi:hypothetical protein
MRSSWLRRIAALEARCGIIPEEYVLTPHMIRRDVCSPPLNACFFDDASPDDRANGRFTRALGFGAPGKAKLSPCKSPVDSLYYQAGCLITASQPLFFRRSVA